MDSSKFENEAIGAAEQYKVRDSVKEPLRKTIEDLINKGYNMTQISRVTGIKRTTLYYIMWGRVGRRSEDKSHRVQLDSSLPVHGGESDYREVA